jgi:hypothetical protein
MRMKKKSLFLNLVLITVAAVILAFPLRSICEDDDTVSDGFCKSIDFFQYHQLFDSVVSLSGVFYSCDHDVIHIEPIISYLEMQEKSPPQVLPFSIFK